MADLLVSPPVAFLLYLVLVGILFGVGRALAGRSKATALKTTTYASGEAAPSAGAAPGYGSFFVIALFFAVLHLGVLMLASSSGTIVAAVYVFGLALALLALILG